MNFIATYVTLLIFHQLYTSSSQRNATIQVQPSPSIVKSILSLPSLTASPSHSSDHQPPSLKTEMPDSSTKSIPNRSIDGNQSTASPVIPTPRMSSTFNGTMSSSYNTGGGGGEIGNFSTVIATVSTIMNRNFTVILSSASVHIVMTSSIIINQTTTTTTTTTKKPKVEPQNCNEVDNGFCQNGGLCINTTMNDGKIKPSCGCSSEYYGDNCEKKALPPIYEQLTYALGGTTVFLLVVVIVLICCRCQNRKSGKGELPYSEELDNFSVSNKRASAVFPSKPQTVNVVSYENNGIDMYGD